MISNEYTPFLSEILDIKKHTDIEYTFKMSFEGMSKPGQFFQVSIPKFGEAPISISGIDNKSVDLTIRKVGKVTNEIFEKYIGNKLFMRGPYGNGFDVNLYKNKDYPALEKVFVPYTKAMVKSLKNDEVFIPDEELQHIYLDMLGVAGRTNLKKKVEKFWK